MKIKIGTRGSMLALAQTKMVQSALLASEPTLSIEVIEVKTLGDRKQGTAAASHGDKKDWILELELAVLSGEIDLAVHSGKDVPADIEVGTELSSVLRRENPLDVFIGRKLADGTRLRWNDLPNGAIVGTASLRRQASLRRIRSDLRLVEHRGNVPTRLRKLDESSEMHGIVLAEAGIKRLNLTDVQYDLLDARDVMPAVNQGIMCVQYRSDRADIRALAAKISDLETQAVWLAERGCVEVLGADCKSAVSVFAEIKGHSCLLSARVMSPDGVHTIELDNASAPMDYASDLGRQVADQLLEQGAAEILEASRLVS